MSSINPIPASTTAVQKINQTPAQRRDLASTNTSSSDSDREFHYNKINKVHSQKASQPTETSPVDSKKHAAFTSKSITIQASPEYIWHVLSDITKWPDWVPGVGSTKAEGKLQEGSSFDWRQNGFSISSRITEAVPLYKLAWDGKAFGTQAHHEWTLIPHADGSTTVKTTESLDGILPSLFSGTMQKTLDSSLPEWLAALKQRAESIQPVNSFFNSDRSYF